MSDLEQTIIAFCIQDKGSLATCLDRVEPDFFEGVGQHVFKAIREYYLEYKECVTRKLLEKLLDGYGLEPEQVVECMDLFDAATSEPIDPKEFNYHLNELAKGYLRRVMERTINGYVDDEGNSQPSILELSQEDPFKAYDLIKRNIAFKVENARHGDAVRRGSIGRDIDSLIDNYLDIEAHPEKAYGIKTGYTLIDEETLGLLPGQLFIIGGASSSGKSIFLLNIAANAYRAGKNILMLSLEMSLERYWQRFVSCYCEVPEKGFKTGTLTKEDKDKIFVASEEFKTEEDKGHFFKIVDIPAASALSVEAEVERVVTEYGKKPDVVFVDYLGIMRANGKTPSEVDWQIQARIAEELRSLARNLQIPVVSAVQLNRDKNHGTGLDRIARSKIIGDTCDVFLQIMEKDEEEDEEGTAIVLPDNVMRVYFGKVREGRRDYVIELWKDFSNMRIKNKDDISVLSSELGTLNTIESTFVQSQEVTAPPVAKQDNAQDKLMRENGEHIGV